MKLYVNNFLDPLKFVGGPGARGGCTSGSPTVYRTSLLLDFSSLVCVTAVALHPLRCVLFQTSTRYTVVVQ